MLAQALLDPTGKGTFLRPGASSAGESISIACCAFSDGGGSGATGGGPPAFAHLATFDFPVLMTSIL
jgi:hypothetical protein